MSFTYDKNVAAAPAYISASNVQEWITYRLTGGAHANFTARDLEALQWLVRAANMRWLEKWPASGVLKE